VNRHLPQALDTRRKASLNCDELDGGGIGHAEVRILGDGKIGLDGRSIANEIERKPAGESRGKDG